MKRIFICSPFRADTEEKSKQYLEYARQLCKYAFDNNCAPFAPHLLYPEILYPGIFDDGNLVERSLGIRAGLTFMSICQELWLGSGFGISESMRDEIFHANYSIGIPVREVRREADRGFVIVDRKEKVT